MVKMGENHKVGKGDLDAIMYMDDFGYTVFISEVNEGEWPDGKRFFRHVIANRSLRTVCGAVAKLDVTGGREASLKMGSRNP